MEKCEKISIISATVTNDKKWVIKILIEHAAPEYIKKKYHSVSKNTLCYLMLVSAEQ